MENQHAILFQVNQEDYGADIRHIQAIERMGHLKEISGLPPEVRGISKIREEMIPVIDAGVILHHKPLSIDEKSKLLIFSSKIGLAGLLVSDAKEMIAIHEGDIKPFHLQSDCFKGVLERNSQLIIQLDLDAVTGRIAGFETISEHINHEHTTAG
ncbi:chemotaxis protein CheW [Bacillus sonorensis]|uniref:chemotaxis protein CheW n=1 Tax=Bacillus sonorensis TaxID=119858 RepID=UPI002A69882E|nr:chemotaxis protein CheW [Bacillus sonorensis]WPP35009.1 chemotaxis protein CheW [Bacillus sonorensis]